MGNSRAFIIFSFEYGNGYCFCNIRRILQFYVTAFLIRFNGKIKLSISGKARKKFRNKSHGEGQKNRRYRRFPADVNFPPGSVHPGIVSGQVARYSRLSVYLCLSRRRFQSLSTYTPTMLTDIRFYTVAGKYSFSGLSIGIGPLPPPVSWIVISEAADRRLEQGRSNGYSSDRTVSQANNVRHGIYQRLSVIQHLLVKLQLTLGLSILGAR